MPQLSRRDVSALIGGVFCASALSLPLRAQSKTGEASMLVELFTSQGCSSCPPADALMLELATRPDLLPLTFAVEVWDYLGWRDTLAKPLFTARQKAYAAMVANNRLYTPQAIINGRAHCVGSDRAKLEKLAKSTAEPGRAAITITPQGADQWLIEAAGSADARVFMLPVSSRKTVPIGRGENSGRTITYANVVRGIEDRGALSTAKPVSFILKRADLASQGADCAAVLVQAGSINAPGAVFAAGFVNGLGGRA